MAKVGNYAGGLEADVVELEWIDADEPGAVFALLAGRRLRRGFLVRSLAALARGGLDLNRSAKAEQASRGLNLEAKSWLCRGYGVPQCE